jgi:hypothetical protein
MQSFLGDVVWVANPGSHFAAARFTIIAGAVVEPLEERVQGKQATEGRLLSCMEWHTVDEEPDFEGQLRCLCPNETRPGEKLKFGSTDGQAGIGCQDAVPQVCRRQEQHEPDRRVELNAHIVARDLCGVGTLGARSGG